MKDVSIYLCHLWCRSSTVMEEVAVGRFVRRSGGCLVLMWVHLHHVLTSVQPKMMINIIVIQYTLLGIY